jgi:hypothetical protein
VIELTRDGRFGTDHDRMAAWIEGAPRLVVVADDLGTAMACLEVAARSIGIAIRWPAAPADAGADRAGS